MSNDAKRAQIANAAEALVEAAEMEVGTSTQQKLSSMDDKLKAIDSKVNTVNQHIVSLKNLLASQAKRQRLEFVISFPSLIKRDCFTYYLDRDIEKSSTLVEDIVKCFALGYSYSLPINASMCKESFYDRGKEEQETQRKLFYAKLIVQLQRLIGHKPRLE